MLADVVPVESAAVQFRAGLEQSCHNCAYRYDVLNIAGNGIDFFHELTKVIKPLFYLQMFPENFTLILRSPSKNLSWSSVIPRISRREAKTVWSLLCSEPRESLEMRMKKNVLSALKLIRSPRCPVLIARKL